MRRTFRRLGRGVRDFGVFTADRTLNMIGATDAIGEDHYKTGIGRRAGEISATVDPFLTQAAATAVGGPMAGQAMGGIQRGVGALTQDTPDRRGSSVRPLDSTRPNIYTPTLKYGGNMRKRKYPSGGNLRQRQLDPVDIQGDFIRGAHGTGISARLPERIGQLYTPTPELQPWTNPNVPTVVRNLGATGPITRRLTGRRMNTMPVSPTISQRVGAGLRKFQGGGGLGAPGERQFVDYEVGQDHVGPDGGIPVDEAGQPTTTSGRPAVGLTEKGEVTYNGQVFSDTIKLPGNKKRTFADEAKRIAKKHEFYLGEKLDKKESVSEKALERELQRLYDIQEARKGNMIHEDDVENLIHEVTTAQQEAMQQGIQEETMMPEEGMPSEDLMMGASMEEELPMMQEGGDLQEFRPAEAGVGRTALSAGMGMMNPVIGLIRNRRKQSQLKLPRTTAETINLGASRAAMRDQATTGRSAAMRRLRGMGAGAGATMAGMQATDADIRRNLGEGITQSHLAEQTTNLQERQRAREFNLNALAQERMQRHQQELHRRQTSDALIASMGRVGQQAVRDYYGQQDYFDALSMMSPDYYMAEEVDPTASRFKRIFGRPRRTIRARQADSE